MRTLRFLSFGQNEENRKGNKKKLETRCLAKIKNLNQKHKKTEHYADKSMRTARGRKHKGC